MDTDTEVYPEPGIGSQVEVLLWKGHGELVDGVYLGLVSVEGHETPEIKLDTGGLVHDNDFFFLEMKPPSQGV